MTAGRASDGERQGPEILGSEAAAGEGTAIRVFWERHDDGGGSGGRMPWHIIHPIAIKKSVPAPELRVTWRDGWSIYPRSRLEPSSSASKVEVALVEQPGLPFTDRDQVEAVDGGFAGP